MNEFLSGANMLASAVIGLFFLRFWKKTGDRFFGIFSLAFWCLALERLLIQVFNVPNEERSWFFIIRCLAFIFIMWAIVDKNRKTAD